MEKVPVDDIMEVYGKLSEEKKVAVTNLMRSAFYVTVCAHNTEGNKITMNWQANQSMSIHLIMSTVVIGRNEYGRLWLDDLKSKLFPMA